MSWMTMVGITAPRCFLLLLLGTSQLCCIRSMMWHMDIDAIGAEQGAREGAPAPLLARLVGSIYGEATLASPAHPSLSLCYFLFPPSVKNKFSWAKSQMQSCHSPIACMSSAS
uniref:Secreted protein n=1 Tax=Zea mays TaxID=4577 RepID=C0P2K5_MAIZE|nr:unknown [Zea mays]